MPTTDWLFVGRFVVNVLCIVLIWGTVLDTITWLRTRNGKRPYWPFQWMLVTMAVALLLTTPVRYTVARRLTGWTGPSDETVTMFLFIGCLFAVAAFIFAQVSRAYIRGASKKKLRRNVLASLVGIFLLVLVGVGIDVRFP
jgi:hypothetical protein